MSSREKTQAKWSERVHAWRASGKSAGEFAAERGFEPTMLYRWSSRVPRTESPGFVRLVAKTVSPPASAEVIVEVGAARVRVGAGFDGALLAEVVRALAGAGR
jgi:hypothetical protein